MKKALLFLFLAASCLCEAAPAKLAFHTEPVDGNIMSWKGYRRLFHSIHGSPCDLTYSFFIPAKSPGIVKDSTFTVFVPDGVRVEGILASFATNRGVRIPFKDLKITKTKVKGGTRYLITNLDPFFKKYPTLPYTQKKELTFYFEQEKFDSSKEYKVTSQWMNKGKKVSEEFFILKFLPPVPKKPLPKNFLWHNFVNLWHINVPDEKLLKKIIIKYADANIASRASSEPDYPETVKVENFLRKNNWKIYKNFFATTSVLTFRRDFAKGIKSKPSLMANGKKSGYHNCPTSALKNQALIDRANASAFNKSNLRDGDIMVLDIEPFHYWNNACFCDECLDAFSKEFKIPRANLTSPQVIRTKYEKQWLRHLCLVQFRAQKIACDAFRKKFPNGKVMQYNYLLDFGNPAAVHNHLKICPQDPRDFDKIIDCHAVSVYSLHAADMIKRLLQQRAYMKKPVSLAISLDRAIGTGASYMSQNDVLTPKRVRLNTLAAASAGGTYLLSFAGIHYDGWMYHWIARAMHEIAVFEDFYFKGKHNAPLKVTLDPAWDTKYEEEYLSESLSIIASSLGNDTLGTVFNFHGSVQTKARLRYDGPLKKFYVTDIYNKKYYQFKGSKQWTKEDFNKSFVLMIPPEDAAFILISAKDPLKGKKSSIHADMKDQKDSSGSVLEKVAVEKKMVKDQLDRGITPKTFHGASVKVQGDNVTISTASQEIVISLKSALMTSWKNKLTSKTIFQCAPLGIFNYGKASLWSKVEAPHRYSKLFSNSYMQFKPYNFRISDDGHVQISFGYLTDEFFVYKTLDVRGDKASFTFKSGIRNMTPYSNSCALRFRMVIDVKNGVKPEFILDGKKTLMTRSNNHFAATRAQAGTRVDADYRGPFKGNTLKGKFNGNWINLSWNPRDVQTVLVFNSKPLGTMEFITPVRKISSLKESSYSCTLSN